VPDGDRGALRELRRPGYLLPIGATLALYLAEFEIQEKAALTYGLNPRRQIGDILWPIREDVDSVSRQPAVLIDVSAEGGSSSTSRRMGRSLAMNSLRSTTTMVVP
jgi:hypothetical protein